MKSFSTFKRSMVSFAKRPLCGGDESFLMRDFRLRCGNGSSHVQLLDKRLIRDAAALAARIRQGDLVPLGLRSFDDGCQPAGFVNTAARTSR
jgi:hypothetical protein